MSQAAQAEQYVKTDDDGPFYECPRGMLNIDEALVSMNALIVSYVL